MLSRRLVLTFSAFAVTAFCQFTSPFVTTADAQGRPVNRIRFAGMDANNDGVITREEWRGSRRSFEVHDWNGDGRLSGDEVRTGARRNADWETADHDPNFRERNLSWTRNAFNALDHNRNQRIEANEWHFDRETFLRVDRNRDNILSLQEYLGEGVDDDLRGDNFDDMDYNNDGRIARTEWYGGAEDFRWLDRNKDGFLTRYEVAGSEAASTTWNEFQSLDYDRNGSLSRAEWHWSNASFMSRDTNRDGVLTAVEFETAGGAPGNVGAIAGQPSASTSPTVRVSSQMRWTDTGIIVRAGDVITFNASGQIQMSDNNQDVASTAGSLSGRKAPDAPINGVLAGALIGRIGSYGPIAIGNQAQITAPASGQLYLGVNDDHLPDNRGEFVVTVGVQRR